MRKIEFRAWDKYDKKLYRVCDIDFINSEATVITDEDRAEQERRKCKNIELMQFTALLDKNGKEIFEGDLIKTLRRGKDIIGEIAYCDKWASFYFGYNNPYGVGIAENDIFEWHYRETHDDHIIISEVVGNIYENPELLKEAK